ncbi:uncharacterized protein L203_100627 [Cryptococcus depauperatus CBS 7841]|uniref:Uncharacterized protein n=1 Tax=Cryptococcus depauperatus CBS 7841 TaxID=1295531 RepID=A0AAJ8JNH5_9TREE
MSLSHLWISDASPLFFYSPAEAYFAGKGLNAWVGHIGSESSAGAATGGNTPTFHSTKGKAGVILPLIYATNFAPIFSELDSHHVVFSQNSDPDTPWKSGQNWTSYPNEFKPQTFTLTVECKEGGASGCDQDFRFQGAWVETHLGPNIVTLDDSSPLVKYSGFAPVVSNNTAVQVSSADQNSTLSMTTTAGATAQVMFKGASITVTGVVCPTCSTYTVNLDSTKATYDSSNNATVHDTLLFFATNLDTSTTHTLQIEAQGGGLVIDGFTAFGPKRGVGFIGNIGGETTTLGPTPTGKLNSNSSSSDSAAPANDGGPSNVGVIIGAILGSLAGLVILWYIYRRVAGPKKPPKNKDLNSWDEANLLQNMKNEGVHITTAANQRYVYPGLIAHSQLKK